MLRRIPWAIVTVVVIGMTSSANGQEAKPTPAGSWQRLKDGNARFAADKPAARNLGADRPKELAKGQHPFLRVAGNIADPAVVGSVEYAVEHLHAPLIVVLGHESCGAVAAALDGKPLPGDLGWLVKQVKVGDKLPADKNAKFTAAIRNNALAAAKDLELRSKVIHEEVAHKKVLIVSAVYSLKTGQVEWLTTGKVSTAKALPSAETPPGPRVVEPPARFPRLRALFQRWR
ncbi:MAG: hypothetical protein HYR84_06080 [Planctomycetes bacterium]|nr:hypothetical protein [Planctomycetota bacterium]